jgi:tetratricopeptide (TPR) repeat protein/predicted Ser/Thr protein kinase
VAIDIKIPGFDLDKEIGEGGMARVFLGVQTSLGREVAIKVMKRELGEVAGGEDFQARFLHEGQMLAKLIHPNIVPIHDIGQTDESFYMAMEYLKGGNLSERMQEEGLSVAEVIRICTQIAHALETAHQHKIIHRDMKPANIMFRDDLTPVLTDFGIAKQTDSEHSLTKTGMVIGTPYYMSPEQITGKDVDGRADLYSLGVMFYELLVGHLPFRAEEPLALAMQHVQEEPPPLPESVVELQPIMDRMLAKNPDDRYQSMLEFCQAVRELVMSEATFAAKLSGDTKLFDSDQFSDPRYRSGGLNVPERVTRDIKKMKLDKKGFGWKLPAAALTAVAAAVAVYFMYFAAPPSGLTEQQEKVVRNLLTRVDGYLSVNQIDEPEGANAVASLKQVLKIAPQYPDALEAGLRIAEYYEIDAQLELDSGNLEAAQAEILKGLELSPANQPLLDLKAQVDVVLVGRQNKAKVIELLAQADAFVEANQLITPDTGNAYKSFKEVQALDAGNDQARNGLVQIQRALVADAEASLIDGDFSKTRAKVETANRLFPNSSLVSDIRQRLFAQQQLAQAQEEVKTLLARAKQQLDAEQYVEPAGGNALDSYTRVLDLDPDNTEAGAGLQTIADHFNRLAKAALDQGDFSASLELAYSGLRAIPDNADLLAIQETATNSVGSLEREILQLTQKADRLAQNGRFLPPGDNALDIYKQVLERDQTNQHATQAIARMPVQIVSTVEQYQRRRQYNRAVTLLTAATSAFPSNPRFAELNASISGEMAEEETRRRLQSLLATSDQLIKTRPVTTALIAQAGKALKDLLNEFPNDATANSQLGQFTTAISEQAEQFSRAGSDDDALSLISSGLREFRGNSTLTRAQQVVSDRQAERIAEEAARLAAMSGRLAIDAEPWGEVVEVRDASGKTISLPPDNSTPLVLSLVEGQYSVTVRGDSGSQPVKLDVNVARQKLVQTRAEFRSMTAEQYFERSGW